MWVGGCQKNVYNIHCATQPCHSLCKQEGDGGREQEKSNDSSCSTLSPLALSFGWWVFVACSKPQPHHTASPLTLPDRKTSLERQTTTTTTTTTTVAQNVSLYVVKQRLPAVWRAEGVGISATTNCYRCWCRLKENHHTNYMPARPAKNVPHSRVPPPLLITR